MSCSQSRWEWEGLRYVVRFGRRSGARGSEQPSEPRNHRQDEHISRSRHRVLALVIRESHPERHRQVILASILRSEEHTSELQSLMLISYAVFCLKIKQEQHQ